MIRDTSYRTTVLVVDDMSINVQMLTLLLEDTYEVLQAYSAAEAWELLSQGARPDLILLDVEMPQMSGYELCAKLKDQKTLCTIPIVFVTAKTDTEDEAYGLSLGAVDYITKPYQPDIVKIRVHNYIEREHNKALLTQYKNIVDQSAIVSKSDPNGLITYVNETFCEISGYTPQELIGNSHRIVRHPDTPASVFTHMWEMIKIHKDTWHGVLKNRKKDGSAYWVKSIIAPILDLRGEVIEFIAMRTDITEQELVKEYFQYEHDQSNQKFKEALRLAKSYEEAISQSNVLSRTDVRGRISYVNDTFERISGYTSQEVIGKSHKLVRHEDTPSEVFKVMWDTIKAGNTWKGILKNKAKDGSPYWVDTTIAPISDDKGEIKEFLAIRHDLTELFLLHEEIESTQREIVYKMGEIGESRSQETGNHVKRVAEYSKLLAKLSGLSDEQAQILFTASPMHDIGKVGIPDAVLKKEGPLDASEWVIMKNHAQIGHDILKGSTRAVLQAAAIVAGEHHEKWDGSGYPKGLCGDAIHIYGRITAMADVFDALGSERCYKKAWPLEKILDLFQAERERHFDPTLVDLFFENLDSFIAIRDRYQD